MIKEYGLDDLSPSSMLDLSDRMFEDAALVEQYQWNSVRRAGAKPSAKVHDHVLKCFIQSTETFENDDCIGRAHTLPLKSLDQRSLMEDAISNWILVSK